MKFFLLTNNKNDSLNISYPVKSRTILTNSEIQAIKRHYIFLQKSIIQIKTEKVYYYTINLPYDNIFLLTVTDSSYPISSISEFINELTSMLNNRTSFTFSKEEISSLYNKYIHMKSKNNKTECINIFSSYNIDIDLNRDSYHDEILSINSKKATKKSLSNNDTFIELPKMKSKKSITNSFFGKKKGLDDLNISEIENTSQYNLTFIDTTTHFDESETLSKKNKSKIILYNHNIVKANIIKWKWIKVIIMILCILVTLFFVIFIPFFMYSKRITSY